MGKSKNQRGSRKRGGTNKPDNTVLITGGGCGCGFNVITGGGCGCGSNLISGGGYLNPATFNGSLPPSNYYPQNSYENDASVMTQSSRIIGGKRKTQRKIQKKTAPPKCAICGMKIKFGFGGKRNKKNARKTLKGGFGFSQLGQMSIYPNFQNSTSATNAQYIQSNDNITASTKVSTS